MKVSDLLDQLVFDASDTQSGYRTAALRWLNLARSFISSRGRWKFALDERVTITTAAATTSGVYDMPSGYDNVYGQYLYDETNNLVLPFESLTGLRARDEDKSVTGTPAAWADAGLDSDGNRQIYLWPIPDGAYTIAFPAYRSLTDLTTADESDTVDPFYGPILPWGPCFVAGMRYYHDLNNNEDGSAVAASFRIFEREIKMRREQDRLSITAPHAMENIRSNRVQFPGRFNPAHFNNRA